MSLESEKTEKVVDAFGGGTGGYVRPPVFMVAGRVEIEKKREQVYKNRHSHVREDDQSKKLNSLFFIFIHPFIHPFFLLFFFRGYALYYAFCGVY
jgi:hypothetical protein